MNERPSKIPFSIIRDLRCRNCQNVVSCGPVHVLPDENVLCGRCKHFAKDIYRNYPFEALASMFFYPCRNWDGRCPRILRWNECMIHEDGCSYESVCSRFWKHPKAFLKGKRDMPYGGKINLYDGVKTRGRTDVRLVSIPEKLLDFIKCVQCESYLSCEPVYIRSDGKNICHRCIYSNGVPPDCIRNMSYETLSCIIIFPCVFRNRGCPTRLKFGTDLWDHEAKCSYNQMFKKITPEHEITAIKYGGLSEFEIKKKLVQSLKNKQEKRHKADIETTFTKMSSEEGSDKDSDKGNSYDKHLSDESTTPSPSRLEDPNHKLRTPAEEPKSASPIFVNSPKDFLHFNFNNPRQNGENYHQNINLAQVHYSYQNGDALYQNTQNIVERSDENEYMRSVSENNNFNQHGYYDTPLRSPSILKTPLNELDFNPLDGHSPIYVNPYGQGLIPKPSFKGVVRTDSISSNRELIKELRVRQSKIKKPNEKRDGENPYKECQNLGEIIEVHKQIDQ